MFTQSQNLAVLAKPGSGVWQMAERPMPVAREGYGMFELLGGAVCASDPHIVHDPGRGSGEEQMVMGHEGYGRILEDTSRFRRDDLVGIIVRGLTDSVESQAGFRNHDPNDLKEKGIFNDHGLFVRFGIQPESDLIKIPGDLGDYGALGEPMSVACNMLREAFAKQTAANGTAFRPKRALFAGPGTVGNLCLAAAKVRLAGATEFVMVGLHEDDEQNPGAQISQELGARYVSWRQLDPDACDKLRELKRRINRTDDERTRQGLNLDYNLLVLALVKKLGDLVGEFDMVCESCTDPHFAIALTGLLRKNGISVLSSIPQRHSSLILPYTEGMLWNAVIFTQSQCGIVNAADEDWNAGIAALTELRRTSPETLAKFITHRFHGLDKFGEAIKLVQNGKDGNGKRPVKVFIHPQAA